MQIQPQPKIGAGTQHLDQRRRQSGTRPTIAAGSRAAAGQARKQAERRGMINDRSAGAIGAQCLRQKLRQRFRRWEQALAAMKPDV